MPYRYETHLHTCYGSACGVSTGKEQARFYHSLGFDGIFITDHFFGGNCAVDRQLPWKESIDAFVRGYQDALNEGEKIGLKVFFGWEQGYQGDEYLIFGLSPEWLYAHPEIKDANRYEQMELVHQGGGCVIQAHPFRDRDYIQHIRLALQYCDGIEAVNGGNDPINNLCALNYANEYHLVMTAGSDNHEVARWNGSGSRFVACVELDTPLQSGADFARIVRNRESIRLCYPPAALDIKPEEVRHIKSFWLNNREELIPTMRDWYSDFSSPVLR